jgi:hypothetical protein
MYHFLSEKVLALLTTIPKKDETKPTLIYIIDRIDSDHFNPYKGSLALVPFNFMFHN